MNPVRLLIVTVLAGVCALSVRAQQKSPWVMQESGTTAGLRGIDSVDGKIAWATGTEGTVLRTIDGGEHWTRCAIPGGDEVGAKLDFRGVQAWDAQTAIVMASGPGDKSWLFRTKDGCKSWELVLKNNNRDGFWDAIVSDGKSSLWLLGDAVNGSFVLLHSDDSGKHWIRQRNKELRASQSTQGVFAGSNTSMFVRNGAPTFATGGTGGAFVYEATKVQACAGCPEVIDVDGSKSKWEQWPVPVGGRTVSSGIFSLARCSGPAQGVSKTVAVVAVGGDYTKPDDTAGTAAWSRDGRHWTPAEKMPHGYRSAVQWSQELKAWITAGTNGSDISRDDGKTWQPLDDGSWNALSLPFVVGPKGRIAKLNSDAIDIGK